MRKVKVVCHYKAFAPMGSEWRVYNAETDSLMAEVQSFSFGTSADDSGFIGQIIWLDFDSVGGLLSKECGEAAAKCEIPEIVELVHVVSIDMKRVGAITTD